MTAVAVIEEFKKRGHKLWWTKSAKGGKGGLRCNPQITPELRDLLGPVRDQVIDLLTNDHEDRRRYGRTPEEELEYIKYPSSVNDYDLVMGYLMRQGRGAKDWAMSRSVIYWMTPRDRDGNWSDRQCEMTAAFDLLIWQRGAMLKEQNRKAKEREFVGWLKALSND